VRAHDHIVPGRTSTRPPPGNENSDTWVPLDVTGGEQQCSHLTRQKSSDLVISSWILSDVNSSARANRSSWGADLLISLYCWCAPEGRSSARTKSSMRFGPI